MMLNIHENLTVQERGSLDQMRTWAIEQGTPNEQLTSAGKLAIVQRVLDSNVLSSSDTWKACALGVLFGDALQQAMENRLKWVIAEDELGSTFAMSWKHSEVLVYPLSAIKSRLEDSEAIDVHTLYSEYTSVLPFQPR
ncbi:MAG: DUF3806 domain-containing protein [Pseudomonadota bacterium]